MMWTLWRWEICRFCTVLSTFPHLGSIYRLSRKDLMSNKKIFTSALIYQEEIQQRYYYYYYFLKKLGRKLIKSDKWSNKRQCDNAIFSICSTKQKKGFKWESTLHRYSFIRPSLILLVNDRFIFKDISLWIVSLWIIYCFIVFFFMMYYEFTGIIIFNYVCYFFFIYFCFQLCNHSSNDFPLNLICNWLSVV